MTARTRKGTGNTPTLIPDLVDFMKAHLWHEPSPYADELLSLCERRLSILSRRAHDPEQLWAALPLVVLAAVYGPDHENHSVAEARKEASSTWSGRRARKNPLRTAKISP